MLTNQFNAIYRGVVLDNSSTGNDGGRCKIFVPGIYPNTFASSAKALPWAEPAAPLFGGNFSGTGTKTGICGWPAIGAHVWVFFEQGDHTKPVYFAGIQGDTGWSAANEKQHVIQTERVKIQLDETDDADRLTIDVTGNVNVIINGNVTQQITGDVTETIKGNVTQQITGDVTETITGNVTRDVTGKLSENITGDITRSITGTVSETITGVKSTIVTGAHNIGGSPLVLNGQTI